MRVLITGIAGHLGSAFAAHLRRNHPNCEIVGVDNLSCGYRENVPHAIEWHELDLADLPPDGGAVFDGRPFEFVFHFAAFAAECLSPFVRTYNYRSNVLATAALVNAVLNRGGCRRIVYTSSIAVYGRGEFPFDERHHCQPWDPYGVAKLACEQDLRIAGIQHGLDWCVLRPHNIYGPGQSMWQRYRNVFGLWMRAALEGRPLQIFGDGKQKRAFTYIDDILPCILRAALGPKASRRIINLGGSEPITIRHAAEVAARVMGHRAIEHLEERCEVKFAWCTTEQSEKLLGFADHTPLEVGLRKMWEADRWKWEAFPERRDPPQIPIEVERGLYSFWQQNQVVA